jgi:hypothetical protein
MLLRDIRNIGMGLAPPEFPLDRIGRGRTGRRDRLDHVQEGKRGAKRLADRLGGRNDRLRLGFVADADNDARRRAKLAASFLIQLG